VFGICPYSIKNQNYVNELILYGTMAAQYLTNYGNKKTLYKLQLSKRCVS